MSITHLLNEFGAFTQGKPIAITDVSLEEERLEAFEKGYQAGWEDCVKSQVDDGRRITADLVQNLQDISFTYEEVHAAIMGAMQQLLQEITQTVLPPISHAMLIPHVTEILHDLLEANGRQPLQIAAGPADLAILRRLSAELPDLACTLTEDPTLASGQVCVRLGESERALDMPDVLLRIEQAISGFFQQNQRIVA
ncbi:Flagellar assembly protein H [Roseovarius sp. EC-HK134]|uniref:flagellar biosynthesis protein n=1 Tax=unclassified Roseovarius TaxID=2614913 RepID=UPI0012515640|nr:MULTISPECIES: flagellar biosynthesis protein [unclassified Roseovarius]VVT15619.1 Flagellar assembly protein H [Roseovarius sp. EC-HK134]VVT16233.1 Flagellar assembly protein H [Roseovarius sp. EC-SD190]